MTETTSVLADRCYWPGPRPVRDEDRKGQLRGRDDDTTEIVNEIHGHPLTVLMGESGVGKSSLLDSLIRPRLTSEGFRVLVCHEWSSGGGVVTDIDKFIATKVDDQLPDGMLREGTLAAQIDAHFGQRGVLILDQFEELIRHEPRLFKEVQEWIIDVIQRYDFHVVVSLRSEYEHRLRELRVDDYQRIDIYLEPISDVVSIREIITSGRDESRPGAEIIATDVVDEICRLWTLADGGHSWSGVGLLHLQALLYALWSRAEKRAKDSGKPLDSIRVELKDLQQGTTRLAAAEDDEGQARAARGVFANALSEAVHLRLDRGRSVYEDIQGRDEYLAEGVRSQIARMADHLTSGGYKVDQDRWHLARLVLEEELKTLGIDDDDDGPAAKIFADFARVVDTETHDAEDLERADDESVVADASTGVDWLNADRAAMVKDLTVTKDKEPWDLDKLDVTSGPMMGMPPDHVFVEELRRFFFALEWLRVNSLIHLTTAGEKRTVIALVHDGFGRGLRDWAERNDELAEQALTLLTAAIGETYSWKNTVIGGSAEEYRLIPNLRWRACRISGVDFKHLVFMNCDFRESTFVDCSFHGVTFVNCLLDGVTFRRSRILGAAVVDEVTPIPASEELPSFVVDDPDMEGVLRWYHDDDTVGGPGRQLVSESAGVPLVADEFPKERNLSNWKARTGGLVMYGGRLSSVMFAMCTFEESSILGLFNIAGTSLEFAEQEGGQIYLGGVAVRGLTISATVGLDEAQNKSTKLTEIHVVNSIVQNVWISTGLRGTADFLHTTAWQVFNASDSFTFSFTESHYYGLVNTGIPADTSFESNELSMDGLGGAVEELRKMSRKIDYRSSPASFDSDLVDRRHASGKKSSGHK
jgi:hypothetical protein